MADENQLTEWVGDIVEQLKAVGEMMPTMQEANDISQAKQFCSHCLKELTGKSQPSEAS